MSTIDGGAVADILSSNNTLSAATIEALNALVSDLTGGSAAVVNGATVVSGTNATSGEAQAIVSATQAVQDVPLVTNADAPVLLVDLPTGVAVTARGPSEAVAADELVPNDLVQSESTRAAAAELLAAVAGTQVNVQVVAPVVDETTLTGSIVFESEVQDTGTVEGGAVSLLVIDISKLNSRVELQLNNLPYVVLDAGADGAETTALSDYNAVVRLGGTVKSTMVASANKEVIYANGAQGNVIQGLGGADIIYGGSGGSGSIQGGAGDDLVLAGSGWGRNTVEGGTGNDILVAAGQKTKALETWLAANETIVTTINSEAEYAGLRDLVARASDESFTIAKGDTFKFGDASGVDMVFNFHTNRDVMLLKANLNSTTIDSFEDLSGRLVQVGADTHVVLGAGNTVVLVGVSASDLTSANFGFYS